MKRYQEEMNEIHAPRDLIESTKLKCRQAEFSNKGKIKRGKKIIYLLPAACAAVLFIALIPMMSGMNVLPEKSIGDMQLHLGNQEVQQDTEEKVIIKNVALIPMEFAGEDVEEETIGGKKVYVVTDEEGFYMACVLTEEEYIVIESKISDKEEFVMVVEEITK